MATLPLVATPAHADTVRSLSWQLDSLRISRAHQITKGAGVTVAVVDTGVQATNQDLVGQVVPGKAFGNDVAPDGRTDPDQNVSHGTGMASLIAGRGGGQQRLLGIAPEAKIMPAAVGMARETMAPAVKWAADQGVGVINISMEPSSTFFSTEINDAIAYAQQRDVVVVVSAGNQGGEVSSFARLPGVVSVSAIDRKGVLWEGSNRGQQLAVSAPGVDVIMSVNQGNGYGVGDGTSPAAAITSGVVALIRSKFPDLDAANVVNRLIKTATDKGDKGRDSQFGFGIIDPVRALTADIPTVTANPLGVAAATPDDKASGSGTDESGDDGSGLGIKVRADWGGLLVYGLGCLVVVAAIVILIVWSSRRRRRRSPGQRQPGGPYPGPPGQWGGPPPPGNGQIPPGYGSQPGYGLPPQQPHYPPPPAQPTYGQPPQPPAFGPPPTQPGYGPPPPQQPGYAPPPAHPGYGPPSGQAGSGPPPAQPGYGPPSGQPGSQPPPAQPSYGPPSGQVGYGPPSGQSGSGLPGQPGQGAGFGASAPGGGTAAPPPGIGQPPSDQRQPPSSGDR
ncbi:S8 family serine peptidase [Asanoa hainanensis]|uniref:S8 family serine peptidase n=1 Tax=Asanoa hainanensis TaxID=560556 RepID=UPI0015C5E4A1|nr:S8 family serine peptidase [Asanoa hainanensis]